MNTDIFVICDASFHEMYRYYQEMLGKARSLIHRNERVVAVVLGDIDGVQQQCLYQYGAQQIISLDVDSFLLSYTTAKVIAELARRKKPALIMFLDTDKMKLIASQTATYIGSGLTADCIDIQRCNDRFIFSRAALSSSVIAEIMCTNCDIQLCTVKRGVFAQYVDDTYEVSLSDKTYQRLDFLDTEVKESLIKPIQSYVCQQERQDNRLDTANIIFAIGRGVPPDSIESIYTIAKRFKAAVGCTRIMVENGFLDKSKQIGQSGRTVSPMLYIAIGISGASQHIVGMRKSKTIIAINSDPHAPIMNYADYGIIRDSKEIIENLQNMKNEVVME